MQKQLEQWHGEFGDQYTDRNAIDWRVRLPAFRTMLQNLTLRSVLEVGCNRGHNLAAIREVLGHKTELVGVEPNCHARELAIQSGAANAVMEADAYRLPFQDGRFDLVFTAGVLIHVPDADLPQALDEIHRCSGRYVLAIEYFSDQLTAVSYRGQEDLLWKRDFLAHYRDRFPDLTLVCSGYWEKESGFDRTHWWLLEKTDVPKA